MAAQRKMIGRLDTAGSVAIENAKVYKELRRGRIEPSLASRLSQILINQRVILESFDAEKRIQQLEALLEQAGQGRLLTLKANGLQSRQEARSPRALSRGAASTRTKERSICVRETTSQKAGSRSSSGGFSSIHPTSR